jgi:hypothetical protein
MDTFQKWIKILGAMPLARRSKRVQGEAADPLSFTKWQYKSRTSLLTVFNASRLLIKVSNRDKGYKRRLKPLDLLSLILLTLPSKSRTRKIVIEINISLL